MDIVLQLDMKVMLYAEELWSTERSILKWTYTGQQDEIVPCFITNITTDTVQVQPNIIHRTLNRMPSKCTLQFDVVASAVWQIRDTGVRLPLAVVAETDTPSTPRLWGKVRGTPVPPSRITYSQLEIRDQIKQMYLTSFQCVGPEYWRGRDGVVTQMAAFFKRTPASVERVVRDTHEDPHGDTAKRKTPEREKLMTPEDTKTMALLLLQGAGSQAATAQVNTIRVCEGREPVCTGTAVNAAKATYGVFTRQRPKRPQGGSEAWAITRKTQCQVVLEHRATGEWLPEATLYLDEMHKKCTIGPVEAVQWDGFVDPNDMETPLEESKGGVLLGGRPVLNVKHDKEVRGLFGVMKKLVDGEWKGFKIKPMEYTGYRIVGPVSFKKAMNETIAKVRSSHRWEHRQGYWKCGTPEQRTADVNPFRVKHGDDWKQFAVEATKKNKKVMCVTELMQWAIDQGNVLFADTPFANTWVIWHDALPTWFSKGAQQFLEKKGFLHRQVINRGDRFLKSYRGRLVGNSPELMPLDNNLFADTSASLKANASATRKLETKHADKFDLSTPERLWNALMRTWEHSPSSERIVQDIDRASRALEEIIAADGQAIKFQGKRSGLRANVKELPSTSQKRQRTKETSKEALQRLHPVARKHMGHTAASVRTSSSTTPTTA